MTSVSLRDFRNDWYSPGRGAFWQVAWFLLGSPLVRCQLIPSSGMRVRLLRLFGASIGQRAVIKPGVRVKYPWRLTAGDDCWLGESCWIDNLDQVTLGSNVCLSQGAYLCTGNHDWSDRAFGLVTGSIVIGDGAWVGAKALVAPGITIHDDAIAAAGSVVFRNIPAGEIHMGNPAAFVRTRRIRPAQPTGVHDPAGVHDPGVQDRQMAPL